MLLTARLLMLIAAIVVPGGFLLLGIYTANRAQKRNDVGRLHPISGVPPSLRTHP